MMTEYYIIILIHVIIIIAACSYFGLGNKPEALILNFCA